MFRTIARTEKNKRFASARANRMKLSLPRSAPAVLIASGALLVAATGGAVAGSLVTSADIKDNTIKSVDVRNGTLKRADLSSGTVRSLKGAYGRVSTDGFVSNQSGGITVTQPSTGEYCITAPGFSSASSVIVVSPDYNGNATLPGNGRQSVVETNSGICTAPAFGVITLVQSPGATSITPTKQPFTFQIQ